MEGDGVGERSLTAHACTVVCRGPDSCIVRGTQRTRPIMLDDFFLSSLADARTKAEAENRILMTFVHAPG